MSSIVAFRATTIDAIPNDGNTYNLTPGKFWKEFFNVGLSKF